MSASVWSTESWTWAAIWARSSARARAWRSAMRSRTRLSHQGPKMTTIAAMTRAAPPTGRSAATVVWPSTSSSDAGRPDEHAHDDAGDQPAAALAVGVRPEQRHDVVVDERLLRLVGVAPDEDDHADGQEGRPADEADERDVQGAGDELHRDEQRDEDGGDRPDASAVADGARGDVGGLPLHRDQQPGHGVDEHHHAAGDGQQDEADAHPRGVDPRRLRHRTTDAAQDAVVGTAAQGPQLPADVVVAMVAPIGPVPVPSSTRARRRTRARRGRRAVAPPYPCPSSAGRGPGCRARPATAQSGGHPR